VEVEEGRRKMQVKA
jgi:hypothetical protein